MMITTHPPVHVLLVEDNDVDAIAVERAFRKNEIMYPIVRAIDGVEALEVLRGTNGKKKLEEPFTILLDLHLPRMNGLEFLKALRQDPELKKSVVFMLTTSHDAEDRRLAYESNIAGYMLKPDLREDLMKIAGMLDMYWRVVELPVNDTKSA